MVPGTRTGRGPDPDGLHPVTLMRAVAMLEAQDNVVHVVLDEEASAASLLDDGRLRMNGRALANAPSPRHLPALDPELRALAARAPIECPRQPTPASKVLCFESLMNTDMPHNDNEISQGVLHMVSVLADSPTEVHFANIKMDIIGEDRLTKNWSPMMRYKGLPAVASPCSRATSRA